ncbi:MAG: hypothetical protein WB988_10040 [Candidatus Nitrosopolaris sp.]
MGVDRRDKTSAMKAWRLKLNPFTLTVPFEKMMMTRISRGS